VTNRSRIGYGQAMRCTVRLFAQQRQVAGWRRRDLDVPDGATVRDAWDRLVMDVPALAPGGGSVRFARNAEYVDDDEPLADGDELAIIPPVAGGSDVASPARAGLRRIELHAEPFGDALLAELRATVPTPADGALVLFVGQTRETPGTPAPGQEADAARFAGAAVQGLEYEAFEEMAISVLADLGDEIEQQFGVTRLAILHRTGTVPLGESSVVIAVAASHRGAAFDACRYAIEELKARAPIWKSERFEGGGVWMGTPARHGPGAGATGPRATTEPRAAGDPRADDNPRAGVNPRADHNPRATSEPREAGPAYRDSGNA